ncbi:lipase secretion chaperone [Leptospira idonii]|uniref:Lipase helper protein n=1 Tax=Leptospira idonii TaxID=1193500 RepID=A0A4R9M3G2_9LEPT|nr:lipase secretion chaperone [Leptospira idonii]TGN20662.1 lipase [Leptospira idonii]
MDKKNIFIITGIALVFAISVFFLARSFGSSEDSKTNTESGEMNENSNPNLNPLGNASSEFWDEALSPFREEEKKSYLEILSDLQSGKINFVWEVWALRRKCDKNYTADQCNAVLLAYVDANYDSPDKEKIRDLFESYFKYEAAMHRLEIPYTTSFEDKYEILKSQRKQILGDEKHDLIFGMEESQVNFMEGSRNFIVSSKNMSPEERVRKYQELKKKTYGSYYDSVVSREDKFDHYQTEIELREKEFQNLGPEDKEKKLNTLEVKYFGKERAAAMAKDRKEEADAKLRISEYEKQEKEFLNQNASMSASEKERKLKDLRIRVLGSEEEADAYARRAQFEKETQQLH